MRRVRPTNGQCAGSDQTTHRRSGQILVHPPPATGRNGNLVSPVWRYPWEKVIWIIWNAPAEGRFVLDYRVKHGRRKHCPSCGHLILRQLRKCDLCKARVRQARNKRYCDKNGLGRTRLRISAGSGQRDSRVCAIISIAQPVLKSGSKRSPTPSGPDSRTVRTARTVGTEV